MAKYSMTCTCGQVMAVDAWNIDEAVAEMKGNMNHGVLALHMQENHPGEPVPMMDDFHYTIQRSLKRDEY